MTLWNLFPGGQMFHYDVPNGGCNITGFTYSSTYMPEEAYNALTFYRQEIGNGNIIVTRDL